MQQSKAARLRELIARTVKHLAELVRLKRALEKLNEKRRKELNGFAAPNTFTMFDSIIVGVIPRNAYAVAGYVGGHWPTFREVLRRFPQAKKLSIAVNASEDANCLDVETGDARPDEAPAWVKRQLAHGQYLPVLYANLSTMPAVLEALKAAGIKRNKVRLWVAHYTYEPHIPKGFDACQWTDKALERNLDASLCRAGFLR